MRFWLSHASEVPLREQLVTQIVLATASGELKAGTRLPSTRELARRFRIHANTVSAAYRDLEREGWLELRRGSGVYVKQAIASSSATGVSGLDQLILDLFRSARVQGTSMQTLRARLLHWLELQPPDHFLLIEPDRELADIVSSEIGRQVHFSVRSCSIEECRDSELLRAAIPLALPSRAVSVRERLPNGADCLVLNVRSVTDSLASWKPLRTDVLVGIASRWPDFLKRARTMLVAAGFDPDAILVRDARKSGWQKGLRQCAGVVCDSLTATSLPDGCRAIPFPLLSESSIRELRSYEEFVRKPLDRSLWHSGNRHRSEPLTKL